MGVEMGLGDDLLPGDLDPILVLDAEVDQLEQLRRVQPSELLLHYHKWTFALSQHLITFDPSA